MENSKKIGKNLKKLKKSFVASFQSKISCKRPKKMENKNYRSISFLPDTSKKYSKKIEKKFQKFKNAVVASFQAIIGWNRPRNRENKNYHSVTFKPDP